MEPWRSYAGGARGRIVVGRLGRSFGQVETSDAVADEARGRKRWIRNVNWSRRQGVASWSWLKGGAVVLVVVGATTLTGCFTAGPATRQELCASYDELGTQVMSPHWSDNVIFRDAGSLADVASRYDADSAVKSEAPAINDIANSSSTSLNNLMNATTSIADVCGHPLGIG